MEENQHVTAYVIKGSYPPVAGLLLKSRFYRGKKLPLYRIRLIDNSIRELSDKHWIVIPNN